MISCKELNESSFVKFLEQNSTIKIVGVYGILPTLLLASGLQFRQRCDFVCPSTCHAIVSYSRKGKQE